MTGRAWAVVVVLGSAALLHLIAKLINLTTRETRSDDLIQLAVFLGGFGILGRVGTTPALDFTLLLGQRPATAFKRIGLDPVRVA